MPAHLDVTVLVVGAGPVGLTAARLLGGGGLSCLVADRRPGPQRHPAAHVVNARTLEIFRQAGVDMGAVQALAQDPADAGHVNFVTTLTGDLIGRLPFERQGDESLEHTPTPLRNISQHRLEPLLAAEVAATEGVDLRYGVEWESAVQDDRGVTSTIRHLATGEVTEVRSRYLVAADGAGSRVRKWLDIDMLGPVALQSFIAIHFLADLRSAVADRPGVLHFVMDPAAGGVLVAHDVDREWVFMTEYEPSRESEADYDTERCTAIVRSALGDASADVCVLGAGSWHMTAQVAQRMRSGGVFLVGDAAHRFPPTGGLGLNTGVADAHALAWRLAAVETGWGGSHLLETYEVERRPVAERNCEHSLANAARIVDLVDALGLVADPTTERLQATLADPSRAGVVAEAVAAQATHFDMLGLQLGHVYRDGALARDGDPPAPVADPRTFDPDARVGARLPHAWVEDGRSTLDLVDRSALTLISVGRHDTWAEAVAAVEAPVTHVRVGPDAVVPDGWRMLCGLGADGAVLVRPDQHVAWRADVLPATPAGSLADGVARLVGWR